MRSILNTSNISTRGQYVINDITLIEFITRYPFIYNKALNGFKDADYLDWAWKNIRDGFIKTYPSLSPINRALFTVTNLKNRWKVLKELITKGSEAYETEDLPFPFQQMLNHINEVFCQKPASRNRRRTYLEQAMIEMKPTFASLTRKEQLCLEKDFMNQILHLERMSKIKEQLQDQNKSEVNEKCQNFFDAIGLDAMFECISKEGETTVSTSTTGGDNVQLTEHRLLSNIKKGDETDSDVEICEDTEDQQIQTVNLLGNNDPVPSTSAAV